MKYDKDIFDDYRYKIEEIRDRLAEADETQTDLFNEIDTKKLPPKIKVIDRKFNKIYNKINNGMHEISDLLEQIDNYESDNMDKFNDD